MAAAIKATASLSLRQITSVCVTLAQDAAEFIRQGHERASASRGLEVVDKGGNDPQTALDRGSEALIINGLRSAYPRLKIIGEETGLQAAVGSGTDLERRHGPDYANLEPIWPKEKDLLIEEDRLAIFIDPLDGTREMLKGNLDCVMVLIGIAVDEKPNVGVCAVPFTSEGVYIGALGIGSFVLKEAKGFVPLAPPPRLGSNLKQALGTVAVSNSRSSGGPVYDCVERLKLAIPSLKVVRVGGCGRKILVCALGQADLYVFPCDGTSLWDSCAGEALLRAMGGLALNRRGEAIVYSSVDHGTGFANLEGIIASHDERIVRWVVEQGLAWPLANV